MDLTGEAMQMQWGGRELASGAATSMSCIVVALPWDVITFMGISCHLTASDRKYCNATVT